MRTVPNFESAIARAIARAATLGDLAALTKRVRDHVPDELNSQQELSQRKDLLSELYDDPAEARMLFERIIQGNELQDISFLPRGELVSRAVMRIVLRRPGGGVSGYGTGFLVGDGVLLTNNHVLPNRETVALAEAEAFYERDIADRDRVPWRFAFDPELFFTHEALDFTLVGVAPSDLDGRNPLAGLGWLPLIGEPGKASEGEWLTIIQHPGGQRKQLCVRENQLLKRDDDVLWYSTDTLAGSSGSPVFNNDWLVVALHHSGVPEIKNGKWQTIDGQDYDRTRHGEDDIKWKANEGIRTSRIVETLRTAPAALAEPRLQGLIAIEVHDLRARLPVLYRDGQRSASFASLQIDTLAHQTPVPGDATSAKDETMGEKIVTVRLAVDEAGGVRIVDQDLAENLAIEASKKPKGEIVYAPVDEAKDWNKAKGAGFKADFLDTEGDKPQWSVYLPALSAANKKHIAKLKLEKVYGFPVPAQPEADAGVLDYLNSSIVMNATRRLAFFSAANIDGGVTFNLDRPKDNWLWDDRIERKHQIDNSFYVGNKLDRGHLTRREDLEWGSNKVEATRKANGTCTWTNCSPQHEVFNQDRGYDGKAAALWGGLEKYILEQTARYYQFRVQAFTGSIFGQDDREYRGVKIPMRFWKVVAAVDASGNLFATGYVLNQDFLIERDWGKLDEAAIEQPFRKFETYQVRISEIEAETGLKFTCGAPGKIESLSKYDPLTKPKWKRGGASGSVGAREGFRSSGRLPDDPIQGFGDIILD